MRVAITLCGSDSRRSGIGVYVAEVLPRLIALVLRAGGRPIVIGTREDLEAYAPPAGAVELISVPPAFAGPAQNATWHLFRAGSLARQARASVLLLLAANRRLTLRCPVPTVGVVHDIAQLHVPGKYGRARMLYFRHVVVRALRGLTRLVAVSRATQFDLVRALRVRSDAISVVHNGVDTERFSRANGRAARVLSARKQFELTGPYVLYPARLEHPGKNHRRLLHAFAGSPVVASHRLVFTGPDWGAGDLLRREVGHLGLRDRVRFFGHVDDEWMPGLFAGADAVAMVGLREGFGLPALEALATGTPVVASNTGALPEVVGDLGVLCDPYDTSDIARALVAAVRDERSRERARREGPAWAAKWHWNRTAHGLFAACKQVASC